MTMCMHIFARFGVPAFWVSVLHSTWSAFAAGWVVVLHALIRLARSSLEGPVSTIVWVFSQICVPAFGRLVGGLIVSRLVSKSGFWFEV